MTTKEDWEDFYDLMDQEGIEYMITQVTSEEVPEELIQCHLALKSALDIWRRTAKSEAAKFGVLY